MFVFSPPKIAKLTVKTIMQSFFWGGLFTKGHNVVRNIVVADIATDPNEGIGVMRAFIDL